jgi:hypothetical protein
MSECINEHVFDERVITEDDKYSVAICNRCGEVTEKYETGNFGSYLAAIAPIMDRECSGCFDRFNKA